MSDVADATLAVVKVLDEALRKHDEDEHDGEPCWEERVNVLAFIAHSVGLGFDTDEELGLFAETFHYRLLDYRAIHTEHCDRHD